MSVFWTDEYEATTPWPMTHARILHTSLAQQASAVFANSEIEGFAATNALSPATYTYWQPSLMPTNWVMEFAAPQMVDAIAIGASWIAGRSFRVLTSVSGVWSEKIVFTQSGLYGNGAVLALFEPQMVDRVSIEITGTAPVVGVIYVGQAMVMPRREWAAMPSLRFQRRTEFEQNISEGGQWLGRSIARIATEGRYAWEYLPPEFVGNDLDAFSRAARVRPFFIAAHPSKSVLNCDLAWVRQDIRPERMGIKNFWRVSFDATGYSRD